MSSLQESAVASATPILDSGVLPPAVRRKRIREFFVGMILGALMSLGGFAMLAGTASGEQLNPLYTLPLLIVVFFFAILVHELGHLLAGLAVGFRFSFIQVGPLKLGLEHGVLKAKIQRGTPLGGYAGMHVETVRRLRRRLLVFIVGGPTANLMSVPITVLLVNHVFPGLGRSWVWVPAAQFAGLSLLLTFGSLTPVRGVSDGARIWMLLSSPPRARRWMSIHALGSQLQKGTAAKEWKQSWLRATTALHDGSRDEFTGHWLAYIGASANEEDAPAGQHLERCLELARLARPAMLDLTVREAAIFTAWHRRDAWAANRWVSQIKRPKQAGPLQQIRLQTALLCSVCEFDAALGRWQEGLAWMEKLPPTASNQQLKAAWLKWQREIQERQNQGVAAKS